MWLDRLGSVLGALPESIRRRIALDLLRRCRELTKDVRALERELRGRTYTSAACLDARRRNVMRSMRASRMSAPIGQTSAPRPRSIANGSSK